MNAQRAIRDIRQLAIEHREKLPYLGAAVLILLIYLFSKTHEATRTIYKNEGKLDFKDARILGSPTDSLYDGKERLLGKSIKDIQSAQANLRETTEKLNARLDQLEKTAPTANLGTPSTPNEPTTPTGPGPSPETIRVSPPPSDLSVGTVVPEVPEGVAYGSARSVGRRRGGAAISGPTVISFPVKENPVERTEGVVIPPGSYVKAKLMTGVEAPEGKTLPVLMQLDYAYIVPNKKRIDLSGCFMIAKATGNISSERVEMQADKLSCVSKEGRMFEREINGFVVDDLDNSFAVIGSVISKQDRVASMAFLSSVVEGVGKAIQSAQTTQQTTPLGGSQSVVSGDQMAYIGAGGAASAASMVTQWYLRQAQSLLPLIAVGSGQNVWVVMKDNVRLPNDYFQKALKGGSNVFTYFSRVAD